MSRLQISRRGLLSGVAATGCSLVLPFAPTVRAEDSDSMAFVVHPRGGLPPPGLADRISTLNSVATSLESKLNADHRFRGAMVDANEFAFEAPRSLHKSFDWREKRRVPPVKDQKECGSCFVFAAVGALECAYLIAHKQAAVVDNKLTVSVSEQQGLDCSYPEDNCVLGGWHEEVLFYAFSHGLAGAPPYYYSAIRGACTSNVVRPYRPAVFGYVADPASASNLIASDAVLKQALLQYGPIVTAVVAEETWDWYYQTLPNGQSNPRWPTDGIFPGTPNSTLQQSGTPANHEVVIVGWDDSTGVWHVRNSWGKEWGIGGYMKLKYGCNLVGYGASWVRVAPPDSLSSSLRSALANTIQTQASALTKLNPTFSFSAF
jgi:Papain family cysteine protease